MPELEQSDVAIGQLPRTVFTSKYIIINKPSIFDIDFLNLIILTPQNHINYLFDIINYFNSRMNVIHATSVQDLLGLPLDLIRRSRLIGFLTDAIVPGAILDALKFGAYNFHPGPPSYPGWAPFCFAVYDRATEFGATAHVMTKNVDAGPIVGVVHFSFPSYATPDQLAGTSFIAGIHLLRQLAPALATSSDQLPALPILWGTPKRRRADLKRMCEIPANLDDMEKAHRLHSFTVDDPAFPVPRIVG